MPRLRSRARVAARQARLGAVPCKGPVDGLQKAPQPFLRGLRAELCFREPAVELGNTRLAGRELLLQ